MKTTNLTSNLFINTIFGDNNVFDTVQNISIFSEVSRYTFMLASATPGTTRANYFVVRDPSEHAESSLVVYNVWCYEFNRDEGVSYYINYTNHNGGGTISLCLVDENYTLIQTLLTNYDHQTATFDGAIDISSNPSIKYLLFNLSKYDFNFPTIDIIQQFSKVADHTYMLASATAGTTRANYFVYRAPTQEDPVLNYNVWSYEFQRTITSKYQINYTETDGSGITTLCLVDQNYTLIQKLIIMEGSPVTFNDIVDISSNQNIKYLLFNLNKNVYNYPTINYV